MTSAVQAGRVGASLGQAMPKPTAKASAPASAGEGKTAATGEAALRLITAAMGVRMTPGQALDVSA
jgi:hypothetical protein